MLTLPDHRLSASNSAVISSASFFIPLTLRSEARTSTAAYDVLHTAFEEVKQFVPALEAMASGVRLVTFDEAVAPRLSHVFVSQSGKDHRFELTFALQCPIAKELGFWERIKFIAAVYENLARLVAVFDGRKGIALHLEEARLDQQKDDQDRMRIFRK